MDWLGLVREAVELRLWSDVSLVAFGGLGIRLLGAHWQSLGRPHRLGRLSRRGLARGWVGGYGSAYGARYTNVHGSRVSVSNYNAYNRWGAHAVDVHHTSVNAAGINRTTYSARHLNNVYAGADGSVYRRSSAGWERNEGGAWKSYGGFAAGRTATVGAVSRTNVESRNFEHLNSDFESRRVGEMNYSNFHSSGGFGGYRSFGGGFRGGRR